MNASWPQTKTIWGICVKVKRSSFSGKAVDPAFWKEMSDNGTLERETASRIIGAFINRDLKLFSELTLAYDPDFDIDSSRWAAARRWTPRKSYPFPPSHPTPPSQRGVPDPDPDDLPGPEPEPEEAAPTPVPEEGEAEDEFEKKLRELEAAHKRARDEAAKKRALEKFTPESIEYVKPAIFDDVCAMIKGGVQICLVGPSGCGKSLLVNEVAKVLNKDLYMESFAGGKRYSQVFGSTHLVDGKSEWVPAKFLLELQKENIMVFMDEVMSADPDVLIGANPILDRKTRVFHSPVGVIKVSPTCTICAASNVTGREYSMNYKGTQQQDASVLNRFVHVHMDYDDKVEKTILKKSPLDETTRDFLYNKLVNLRRSVSTHNISYDPSTRKLVQAIELVALGLTKEKAFEYAFLTPLSEVERKKIGIM